MGKQHDTFPGEQPEMPVPKEQPEVGQPSDPKTPEVPQEDPQIVPDEYPLQKIRPKRRRFSPAKSDVHSVLKDAGSVTQRRRYC